MAIGKIIAPFKRKASPFQQDYQDWTGTTQGEVPGVGEGNGFNWGQAAKIGGIAAGVGALGLGISALSGLGGAGKARRDEADAARTNLNQQLDAFGELDTSNLYAGYENTYANMENTYEDLTVNQQQAQFMAQQTQQQQASIMQGLSGAAGASGVGGLAQAMANQGQLQTQQISASIGQQEAANQQAAAAQAGQIQIQERQGAASADLQRRQGAAMVQEAESGRAATLLGMEYGALAGAQEGVQAAYANQQSAIALDMERQSANKQLWGDVIGGVGDIVGAVA